MSIGARAALAVIVLAMAARPGLAAHRHRQGAGPAAPAPAAAPPSFYPNDIAGGVRGNLSFNNQIRKHTDPLNANGGR